MIASISGSVSVRPWHSHSWLCSRFAPHVCAQAGVPVPQRCLMRGKLSHPSDFGASCKPWREQAN